MATVLGSSTAYPRKEDVFYEHTKRWKYLNAAFIDSFCLPFSTSSWSALK